MESESLSQARGLMHMHCSRDVYYVYPIIHRDRTSGMQPLMGRGRNSLIVRSGVPAGGEVGEVLANDLRRARVVTLMPIGAARRSRSGFW
jgi:hypothetical protein